MALTLAQAAVANTNPVATGVINTMALGSPVIDRLPFKTISGSTFGYRKYLALPGVEFRAVNAAYSESTGTFSPGSESLVILGGDADVDNFIIATQGNDIDQLGEQATMKALAIAYKFQDAFINGDTAVDANSFDGIKKRTTGAQVIDFGTNGTGVIGTGTDPELNAWFDFLDSLLAAVPGATPQNSAFYTNANLVGKHRGAMRRAKMPSQGTDRPGSSVYNDIAVLDIGNKADGTPIIPQTETQGTSTVAASIYLVKFGGSEAEQAVTGLQANVLTVKKLGELQTKPVQRLRIDWYPGLAIFGGKAVARGRGVLNS